MCIEVSGSPNDEDDAPWIEEEQTRILGDFQLLESGRPPLTEAKLTAKYERARYRHQEFG